VVYRAPAELVRFTLDGRSKLNWLADGQGAYFSLFQLPIT
jgi:hypothetical protein